jgi:hypothetical protein
VSLDPAPRIAVADDEPGIASTLVTILEMNGFSAKFFTSPLEALTAKRIPSRPGVVDHPNKAVYIRADLTCYSHFSLATRRRTIHTENPTLQAQPRFTQKWTRGS